MKHHKWLCRSHGGFARTVRHENRAKRDGYILLLAAGWVERIMSRDHDCKGVTCQHIRIGFAQTERVAQCANGGYIRIPDAVPYCLDCGRILMGCSICD